MDTSPYRTAQPPPAPEAPKPICRNCCDPEHDGCCPFCGQRCLPERFLRLLFKPIDVLFGRLQSAVPYDTRRVSRPLSDRAFRVEALTLAFYYVSLVLVGALYDTLPKLISTTWSVGGGIVACLLLALLCDSVHRWRARRAQSSERSAQQPDKLRVAPDHVDPPSDAGLAIELLEPPPAATLSA